MCRMSVDGIWNLQVGCEKNESKEFAFSKGEENILSRATNADHGVINMRPISRGLVLESGAL